MCVHLHFTTLSWILFFIFWPQQPHEQYFPQSHHCLHCFRAHLFCLWGSKPVKLSKVPSLQLHLFPKHMGCLDIIDDFTTSFLHFSLFSSTLWDQWTPGLSIPWCCLPTLLYVGGVFFPFSLYLARWLLPDLMNGRHDHTTAVCVSLWWSGGLHWRSFVRY